MPARRSRAPVGLPQPKDSARARTSFESGYQRGDYLAQVPDYSIVGVGQDRRPRIGVHHDDVLGPRTPGHVLEGTANPAGQVELRRDLGAGLPDLLPVRAP